MYCILMTIIWVVFMVVNVKLAKERTPNPTLWIVLSVFFSWIITVIILVSYPKKKGASAGGSNAAGQSGLEHQRPTDEFSDPVDWNRDDSTEAFTENAEITPTEAISQEQAPQMRYIRAVGGYMNGRIYEIGPGETTFGRDRSCRIQYANDPSGAKGISRMHCTMYWKNGDLWLLDQGSSYGTFLLGYGRLQNGLPVKLECGSVFYLGDNVNRFEIV